MSGASNETFPSPRKPPSIPSPACGGGLGWGLDDNAERSEAGEGRRTQPEQLVLDLDGYEGSIDLLLTLAREQKVDLSKISIMALADQYLAFIDRQRQLRLEVAADYLVTAAWLTWLKSRLLLPRPPDEDEPEAAEFAAVLGHRLKLLEAMQIAGRRIMARPRLGHDFFLRGAPEGLATVAVSVWRLGLYELLRAYGDVHRRSTATMLAIEPSVFHSMDEALKRLARHLGRVPDWCELAQFLPNERGGELIRRSALAATFAAALELARDGSIELRQDRAFGPIWLRSPAAMTAAMTARRGGEGAFG